VELQAESSNLLNPSSEVKEMEVQSWQLSNNLLRQAENDKTKTHKMNKMFFENETMNIPVDFSYFHSLLEEKLGDLARLTLSNYVNEGKEDGGNLLAAMIDDLERWTQLLADRRISTRDFETLVMGDKDLVEMDALTFGGLALSRVDQFKGSVLNLMIDTVFNVLKI
jgi:hypothetical protein